MAEKGGLERDRMMSNDDVTTIFAIYKIKIHWTKKTFRRQTLPQVLVQLLVMFGTGDTEREEEYWATRAGLHCQRQSRVSGLYRLSLIHI